MKIVSNAANLRETNFDVKTDQIDSELKVEINDEQIHYETDDLSELKDEIK